MTIHVSAPSLHLRRGHAIWALAIGCLALAGCETSTPTQPVQAATRTVSATGLDGDLHAATAKKVLLVHSYHREYEWVAQITRGVKRSLERSQIELEVFYMDTKRRSDLAWKQQQGRAATRVVKEWNPDVVIAVDDNAQEYFAKRYVGRERPQVVFCGVNAEPKAYGYPAPNVTGILERPYFAPTLDMVHQLLPAARRIAVISDNSPTSAGAHRYMKSQETGFEIVCWETPDTFDRWKEAVTRVQGSADAIATYLYHTVGQEGSRNNVEPRDVMQWTVRNSRIPVTGFFVFAVDDGALCGMVESGVEHGSEAGQMAQKLLQGTRAEDLPIKIARHGQSMLNLDTASRLGIRIPRHVLQATDIVLEED